MNFSLVDTLIVLLFVNDLIILPQSFTLNSESNFCSDCDNCKSVTILKILRIFLKGRFINR